MLAKTPLPDLNSDTSELYVMEFCESCKVALQKLQDAGVEFDVVDLDKVGMKNVFAIWNHRLGRNPNLVPQFWYKGKYIGSSPSIDKFLKEKDVN
ncbi:Glutaredoxin [uncultured Caudovirales phage]|uniref:Glutaredoxin n=1 Tax=uncultured Caudovirales phage TaxID=2100421 RepID=A0A6J5TAC1_9CAUD|nr:Glutaredoxin [uncultured Caudovirales phage]